jgi:Glycine/D-amino acid oxidases (deaminating)
MHCPQSSGAKRLLAIVDRQRTNDGYRKCRWPNSLWVAVTPPGPDLPRLIGTAEADVVVIGGGFTGLSAALHLREAGVDVAIIEAVEPGWGASGRNNGQVIPTLSRHDPEDIIARHGRGRTFCRFVA